MKYKVPNLFFAFLLSINIISLLVHCVGIYCISWRPRWRKENQNILMLNLSILEILLCLSSIFLISTEKILPNGSHRTVVLYLEFMLWISLLLLMIYISIDRLLRAALKTRYKRKITTKLTTCIVTLTWIIGGVSLIPLCLVGIDRAWFLMITFVYTILNIITAGSAILSYSAIVIILTISQNRLRQNQDGSTRPRRCLTAWKPYRAAILIVVTFILFYAIPDWTIAMSNNPTAIHEYAVRISWSVGLVTDPIIYIALIPKNRLGLHRLKRNLIALCGENQLNMPSSKNQNRGIQNEIESRKNDLKKPLRDLQKAP